MNGLGDWDATAFSIEVLPDPLTPEIITILGDPEIRCSLHSIAI